MEPSDLSPVTSENKKTGHALKAWPFYRMACGIALPIAAQNLAHAMITAADVIMLGFIDQNALTATSLAGQFMNILNSFFFSVTAGASVLTAQYWGKKDIASIEKIYGIALRFSLLFALLFFILAFFFPGTLMKLYTSDPDIVLYNEIRNATDATVAMQASNTGHRVFSTVHAADCVRTISRLLDFDISKTTLLSELKLIISQRLVATLCPHCSRPHKLTEEERRILTPEEIDYVEGHLMERGTPQDIKACGHCRQGYSGRTAVAEFVVLDTELRDRLLNQRSFGEIYDVLKTKGYRTMWEKGLDMAVKGQIELGELIHVVGKE